MIYCSYPCAGCIPFQYYPGSLFIKRFLQKVHDWLESFSGQLTSNVWLRKLRDLQVARPHIPRIPHIPRTYHAHTVHISRTYRAYITHNTLHCAYSEMIACVSILKSVHRTQWTVRSGPYPVDRDVAGPGELRAPASPLDRLPGERP